MGIKSLKINNQRADAILGSRASYAHALSPVKRVLGDFLWDRSHEFDSKQTKKIDFVS